MTDPVQAIEERLGEIDSEIRALEACRAALVGEKPKTSATPKRASQKRATRRKPKAASQVSSEKRTRGPARSRRSTRPVAGQASGNLGQSVPTEAASKAT